MAEPKTDPKNQRFDLLLREMPRIAEAVKSFPEPVQAQAFEALLAELRGASTAATDRQVQKAPARRRQSSKTKRAKNATPVRRRTGGPSAVRDLDLAPKGKQSLREFCAEKQPKSNHDRNVVSVYYLSQVLQKDHVTLNEVFTCYRDMNWREPGNLGNSLALTAHRKRFLDTANLEQITITPAGRNHVEHDLPPKKGKK